MLLKLALWMPKHEIVPSERAQERFVFASREPNSNSARTKKIKGLGVLLDRTKKSLDASQLASEHRKAEVASNDRPRWCFALID